MSILLLGLALVAGIVIIPLGLPGIWLMLLAGLLYNWMAPVAPFTLQSFGPVVNSPYMTVEVTNPINTEVITGNSQTVRYAQLTATVMVQLKQGATLAAETAVFARGRITVGPSLASGGGAANYP